MNIKIKISVIFLSFIFLFTGCGDSKSSKKKLNILDVKDCLEIIYQKLEESNHTFQAIQKMDMSNELSNLYRLTYKNNLDQIKVEFIEIKKDCSYSTIN